MYSIIPEIRSVAPRISSAQTRMTLPSSFRKRLVSNTPKKAKTKVPSRIIPTMMMKPPMATAALPILSLLICDHPPQTEPTVLVWKS